MRRGIALMLALAFAPMPAFAVPGDAPDPLHSGRWPDVRKEFFADAPIQFDPRVVVIAPATAEDSMNVPVTVRVEGGLEARRIVVFAELNPIVRVLEVEPVKAAPYVSFRMKLQQGSPVRAAVLDPAGTWHVGGVFVDAAGGGCTAPGSSRANPDWKSHLGEVDSHEWPRPEGQSRLRLRINHPMDTGLTAGIPAFFLQNLTLTDEAGVEYLRLTTFEPLSENPVLGFDLPARAGRTLRLTGVDNNGNKIDRVLQ